MELVQINSFSKIVIVGTSGSGKTTLAQKISHKYNMPDIELDALFWDPQWTPAPPEDFRARVENAVTDKGWVIHGNYSKVRDMIWNKADVIIWLDYPRSLVLWRVLRRTLYRSLGRKPAFKGNSNIESVRQSFFSRDSIILWSIKTFNRNRKLYQSLMADPQFGPKMIRVSSPREAEKFFR